MSIVITTGQDIVAPTLGMTAPTGQKLSKQLELKIAMKARFLAALSGILLSVALGCDSAWATTGITSTPAAHQQVHEVFCQTPQFPRYVKFRTPASPTPGGGPVCYDGIGTATINLTGVTDFSAGAHRGAFQYRYHPELPVINRTFSPGQEQRLSAVEVISLTISS
jgi:hypothetical protein